MEKRERISIWSVVALVISVLAFVMYAVMLTGAGASRRWMRLIWVIASIVAFLYPLGAKYVRSKEGTRGKAFEIIALVLGSFDFYCVFFASTTWSIYIAYITIAIVCVLYAKFINTSDVAAQSRSPEKGYSNTVSETEKTVANSPITAYVDQRGSVETNRPYKQRYCKFCGGAINGETKKCSKCGKQFFRAKIIIQSVVTLVALVAILGLTALSVYQFNRISELTATVQKQQAEIEENQATIQSKSETVDRYWKDIISLKTEIRALTQEISFYDNHVVFVSDDGTRLYHRYGCNDFDSFYFWAYNTEAAENRGYSPCYKCCE